MDTSSFSAKLIIFLSAFSGLKAYAVILGILLLCGLGIPIPEDITLIAAGILASLGNISFTGALISGYIGVLLGDTILFYMGRRLGTKAYDLPLIRRILTPKKRLLAEKKIKENSKFICFTARFLPGLRAPIYLTAGVTGVSPKIFLLLDGFAALISVPLWVYAGYWFGDKLDQALEFAKEVQLYLIAGVILFALGYYLYNKFKKTSVPTAK